MSKIQKAPSDTVAKAAGRMGFATLISRILGLIREQVFAFLFGASHATDAFNIAFRIPNLLRDLFAEGAMSAAFVPTFIRAQTESKQAGFRLLAGVLSFLGVTSILICIVGIAFSPELVDLYAHAYRGVPGKYELTVELTRLMFPFFPLVAFAAVLMGALNALGFFFLPAFAPALFNVASILSGLLLCPVLERTTRIHPIYGMAFGVVVGGFLQFYIQWFKAKREGFSLFKDLQILLRPLHDPKIKQVLLLLVPGTVGLASTQLGILINSIYATSSGAGAVSWLNYAFRLMQFPIGVFGVSLAAATLPRVSRELMNKDFECAGKQIRQSISMSLAVNGPAAAGLVTVGLPIIQLLFQHGQFEFLDSLATSKALICYALGLPSYSLVKVFVPIFYALELTRIPVIVSFLMIGLNACLNYLFIDCFHYPFWSVALATSIAATLNSFILFIILSRRLPSILTFELCRMIFVHFVISVAVGATGYVAVAVVQGWFFEVSVAMLSALFVWFGLGWMLKAPENKTILQLLLKKLRLNRSLWNILLI